MRYSTKLAQYFNLFIYGLLFLSDPTRKFAKKQELQITTTKKFHILRLVRNKFK